MRCADMNPWDSSILCDLDSGHDGPHHALLGYDVQCWADHTHFAGDDCGPNGHPVETGGAA